MNSFDVVLLLIMALSLGAGLMKGLIHEVFSLVGVILGILIALILGPQLTPVLGRWIPYESAAYAAAFLLIFIGVLLATSLVGALLTKVLDVAHLGFYNRVLGGAFGFIRGVLIGLILAIGLTLFLDPGTEFLTESKITPRLAWGAKVLAPLLPEHPRKVLLERLEDLPPAEQLETI